MHVVYFTYKHSESLKFSSLLHSLDVIDSQTHQQVHNEDGQQRQKDDKENCRDGLKKDKKEDSDCC